MHEYDGFQKEMADLVYLRPKGFGDAAMTEYLRQERRPIFGDRGDGGTGHGIGWCLKLDDRIFVRTYQHVAVARESGQRPAYAPDVSAALSPSLPLLWQNAHWFPAAFPVSAGHWASAVWGRKAARGLYCKEPIVVG